MDRSSGIFVFDLKRVHYLAVEGEGRGSGRREGRVKVVRRRRRGGRGRLQGIMEEGRVRREKSVEERMGSRWRRKKGGW